MFCFDNCFVLNSRLLEAGACQVLSRIGWECTTRTTVVEKTVQWKFDRNLQTILRSSESVLGVHRTNIMGILHEDTPNPYQLQSIVCLWLSSKHCICTLVFEITGRTTGIFLVDFIFNWILLHSGMWPRTGTTYIYGCTKIQGVNVPVHVNNVSS